MRESVRVGLVWIVILVVGLVAGELALRAFAPLPVPGGVYLDVNGAAVPVAQDAVTLRPDMSVTHVSAEFRAPITTNALGYRTSANQSATPDLVFLGDSFTFGHAVADDETFVSIACRATGRACQNLGYSGSSSFQQIAVLRHAIETRGMRPKTVALVMLAACWFDAAGNDLGDNDRWARQHGRASWSLIGRAHAADAPAAPELSLIKRLQAYASRFEIGKRAILALAAPLKRGAYACSDDAEAARVMPATGTALRTLKDLGTRYGFETVLFVIHPLQELEGAYRTTEARLRAVVPDGIRTVFTAPEFRPEHYFPYDGHFNAAGHKVMGEMVARSVRIEPSTPAGVDR